MGRITHNSIKAGISLVCVLVMLAGVLPYLEKSYIWQIKNPSIDLELEKILPFPNEAGFVKTKAWLRRNYDVSSVYYAENQIRDSLKHRPLHGSAWYYLAVLKYRQGQFDQAVRYLEIATALWPNRHILQWNAALLWISLGENQRAIDTLRHYLYLQPDKMKQVVVLASRLIEDQRELVETLFPSESPPGTAQGYYLEQFLYYAIDQNNQGLTTGIWQRMDLNKKKNNKMAYRYFNYLLKTKNHVDLTNDWNTLFGGQQKSLINNGGFENELINFGLGWRLPYTYDGHIARDNRNAIEGKASLKLEFDGSKNISLTYPGQAIPVEPGAIYRLTGYWSGKNITTRSGVGVEVSTLPGEFPFSVSVPPRTKTWSWEPFYLEFQAPDNVRLLEIRMMRRSTDALDSKIAGTVWIDDLQLRKVL